MILNISRAAKHASATLLVLIACLCIGQTTSAQTPTGWQLTGNRDANAASFIGTTNGVPVRFGTKNLVRMVIDTFGRVGFGTQAPKYLVDINGKLRLLDGSQGQGKVLTSDSAGVATWVVPESNPWKTADSNLYNLNTGRIGIGTTTPKAKLDVNGDIIVNGVRIGKGSSLYNTLMGANALNQNTTGSYNTAHGYFALNLNNVGNNNTALGANSLTKNTSGSDNTATGNGALQKNTSGRANTANGSGALNGNTGGVGNTAVGDSALARNTLGTMNTGVGYNSLVNNTNGGYNTAVGQNALQYIKSGTYNTALGYNAGSAGKDSAILTNAAAIGANAKVTANNSLVLGNGANVGIGTSAPTAKLEVVGQIKIADGTEALNRVLTSDAKGLAKWKVAPGSLWNSNGGDAYYTLTGNVGIGNATPTSKLSVAGSADISGNVGIGTTTPYAALDVNGNIFTSIHGSGAQHDPAEQVTRYIGHKSGNTSDGFTGMKLDIGAYGGSGSNNGSRLSFQTWGNNIDVSRDVMLINEYGNVGIGTGEPRQRLDVKGNLHFSNADLPKSFMDEVGGTTPLFTMGLNFHEANVNQAYRGGAYRIDSRDGYPMHNWIGRAANSSSEEVIMALRENAGLSIGSTFTGYTAPANGAIIQGNVGIGTVTPEAPLQVNASGSGNPNSNGLYVLNPNNSANQDAIVSARVAGSSGGNPIMSFDIASEVGWSMGIDNVDNYFKISRAWNSLTYDPKVTINTWGQVGIGTTSPGNTLDVNGGFTSRGYAQLNAGAIITNGDANLCPAIDNSKGNVGIGGTIYNNVKCMLTSNQLYGMYINNASPGTGGWALYVNGPVARPGGGSWSNASDARLKENVNPYRDGLDMLLKIKPVKYHYNEKSGFDTKPEYVGVIAQELKEVAPYMVTKTIKLMDDSTNSYLAVDNSAMTYMLINAVKELKGQVDTKDATITKQQAQINVLQDQMAMVLNRLDALQSTQQECCSMAHDLKPASQAVALSSASLDQNIPNPPANSTTRIGYNIPKGASRATMVINDKYGKSLKTIPLSVSGKGSVSVNTGGLASGTYSYTLLVDGKVIDTKQMVVSAD